MLKGTSLLALNGGKPVRQTMLPYGRQFIDEDDIQGVVDTLRSDWITTGPKIAEFESRFAQQVGAQEAVALCNGTAALHAAMYALGISPGDEVIVPTMTFAASANCVVYQGGKPIFVDVEPHNLLVDPERIDSKINSRTKAIVAVDYAGHPCDYDALQTIAERYGLALVADACHALGGAYKGRSVGTLADLTTFSLHPVKHITTGEGGVVCTNDPEMAKRMRIFRNHGIDNDHCSRQAQGSWFYQMVDLGYNYRLTDFQCALGISQLRKLPFRVARRQEIAHLYNQALSQVPALRSLTVSTNVHHAYHLYVIELDLERLVVDRATIFKALRAEGIGVNVHYVPVHLHPFYKQRFGTQLGLCPIAENAYHRILSLPIYPEMTGRDVDDVVSALQKVLMAYSSKKDHE